MAYLMSKQAVWIALFFAFTGSCWEVEAATNANDSSTDFFFVVVNYVQLNQSSFSIVTV